MNSVRVSVVICCYNQARFLRGAIDSVLAQDYAALEVIVINDGSTDETQEVLGEYENIRSFEQTNFGLAAARNAGLRLSRGEKVVFLDADDRLLPEAVESGVQCLEANPECAFVWGRYRARQPGKVPVEAHAIEVDVTNAYAEMLRQNFVVMHGAVMYRRRVVEAVGGFDEGRRACEDYDLYLRITREFPIARHDNVVAEYTRHSASMSANALKMLENVLSVLRTQRPYARAHPEYGRAYRAGTRFWIAFYGRRVVFDIFHKLSRFRWSEATSNLVRLCRIAGAGSLLASIPSWSAQAIRELQHYGRSR